MIKNNHDKKNGQNILLCKSMENYHVCFFHLKTFQVFYENGKIVKTLVIVLYK
jgi:hypothetical protein